MRASFVLSAVAVIVLSQHGFAQAPARPPAAL
jgi:hypothetical protein